MLLLSGYQVGKQIYAGTRTLVYRGVKQQDQKPVVIKLLWRDYPTVSELIQFRNQYTISKNLEDDGIIKVYSLENYHNSYALVMEDFGGISLQEYANAKPLSLDDFFPIALQIVTILNSLYHYKIIHKDIKPANILINSTTKQVKLIDFSIASLLSGETQTANSPSVLEGTLGYISPEQTGRMNRLVDWRSDFYSLGATFYELLTGQLPFTTNDVMELVYCHLAKQAPQATTINSEIPTIISDIIAKLMAKNAEDRYQSVLGLKHDLEQAYLSYQQTGECKRFELGQRDIHDRFTIPEKLYGRELEIETLLNAFERIANPSTELNQSGMILVAGYSGVGKTAIINEIHRPIVQKKGYFIKGKYDQFQRNVPFSGFLQALRDLMQQLLSETDAQLIEWKNKILAVLGEQGQVIIEVIPELEKIIGKQPPVAELFGSAATNRFNLLFQKFLQVFTAKEHPLVIFIDIQANIVQTKLTDALEIGIDVLKLLGIKFSENVSQLDIQQAFKITAEKLANQKIADLIDLPEMTNPNILAAMRILSSMFSAAYLGRPEFMPLISLKMVDLSIQYGNTELSGFGYCTYGFLLCGVIGDIDAGYEFGQLSLNILSKTNATSLQAKILVFYNSLIGHWGNHAKKYLTSMQEAYKIGLETGDLESVGYALNNYSYIAYFTSQELTSLEHEIFSYSETLKNLKQKTTLGYIQICQQTILNLMNKSQDACCLVGEVYNETVMLPVHEKMSDISAICTVYLNKFILNYLFHNYLSALSYSVNIEKYLSGITGLLTVPTFYLYDSLTRLAAYNIVASTEQKQFLEKVDANQEKMKHWANHAPMNFLHKYYLVEAERYRVLGNKIEAIEFYDRAIIGAKENDYIQEEALANELAAKFYLDWGKEKFALSYMQEAYHCYTRWGAIAKVKHLETNYPQLLTIILQPDYQNIESNTTLTATIETVITKSESQNLQLDFATVIKAAQAISQEIELEKLLATLMEVTITSAGAEIARLILLQESNWLVVAQADKYGAKISETPLEKYQDIPHSLIYWIGRNQEEATFENLSSSMQFASDPYVVTQRPKSVLCTAICQQGKLIGILYLENNLTVGAFTSERLQIIQLLGAQAAISLENAQLYQKLQDYSHTLEQKVEQRTQELTQKTIQLESTLQELKRTQAQMIQSEKMSSLGQLVAGVAHEINNPVSFIYGNITYVGEYAEELLELVELCRRHQVNIPSEIQELLESGDFEYIQQDLPNLLKSMKVGTTRIQEIVLSLRTFSRMDEAEFKKVDIHSGIDSTLIILQHRLQAKPERPAIQVIKQYDKLPLIECYARELNQVFLNILTNSIEAIEVKNHKFTSEGIQIDPHQITIRTSLINFQWLEISIKDNGIGMTPEVQKQMLNPFFTTKPVGSGTGMGMPISYQIITEKHGGKLNYVSEPNQGAEFVIQIPTHPILLG
jgi:signal transduction histidine kinase/serine/threonine protein kinase